jgi:hypothetical protein
MKFFILDLTYNFFEMLAAWQREAGSLTVLQRKFDSLAA